MRLALSGLALALGLALASPSLAAPTCQDRSGATIKCGVEGAMPVGWTLPDEERLDAPGPAIDPMGLAIAVFGIGGLLALIASMPEFDGWDAQEGDDERRR